MPHVITVDGPGGSGKSTVSRGVARRLGWDHLDTGAFYRAAALAVLESGVDPSDESAVVGVVGGLTFDQQDGAMYVDGRDVSRVIRTEDVTRISSGVSVHPRLRALMVDAQRQWADARAEGCVVEGRDIGTVVFPSALVKVFLTADPDERARRRAGESGGAVEEVATALAERDRTDSTRAASPLEPAADAIVIDTTGMAISEVIARVIELADEAGIA